MRNLSISILLLVLLTASMLLITGCPRVHNKVPTVNKVSGPSGTISQSSSTFTWNGTDSDGTIDSYEHRKDSGSWVSNGTNTSYVWNDYSEGSHTFEVRAKDNKGGYSEPVSWSFTYHVNTVPVLTKAGGRSGITRQNSSAFYWIGEDNDGNISRYEYRKDEGSWINHSLDLSYIWSGYTEGQHKFEIRAQDNDGAYSNTLTWNFTYDPDSSFPYAITVLSYWETDDLDAAVKSELGANATVADWDEIKAMYSENIGEFIEAIGLGLGDEDILLQRDGEEFYEANDRHYFMTRFDGDVPNWYLVHDQIDDYTLVLGSWYGVKDRVLAKLSDNIPPVVTKVDGPDEETTDGSSTFVWTGVDSDGSIVKYECRKDEGSWVSNGTSTSYTWSGYSEGTHKFEVRAQDEDEQYSETVNWEFEYTLHEEAPTITWQKFFGGSGSDGAYSVQQTSDGGYLVFGGTDSNDGDVSGNHGKNDYWVLKLDSTGSVQWQKCLGGSLDDNGGNAETGHEDSIQQTSDGGYIIVGFTESNDGDVSGNHGKTDFWVVKLNSTGEILWQKCLGGSSFDYGHSIQQTSDSGYIVAGATGSDDGDVSGNHGSSDFWVVKLDSTGNILWQKCLGGSGVEGATSVEQTTEGGYIVAGVTDSNDGDVSENHGSIDAWVAKLNSTGNIQWQKCLGEDGFFDIAISIKQTSDNGYVVAGFRARNEAEEVSGILIKLDISGNANWQRCFNERGKNLFYSVRQTNDNGYIVAGTSLNYEESAYLWLLKLD